MVIALIVVGTVSAAGFTWFLYKHFCFSADVDIASIKRSYRKDNSKLDLVMNVSILLWLSPGVGAALGCVTAFLLWLLLTQTLIFCAIWVPISAVALFILWAKNAQSYVQSKGHINSDRLQEKTE